MASARDKIRAFFEANIGKVVTTHQIQKVAGISEYARRIRELRNEEGMKILSHKDRANLKPNQYLLLSLDRTPVLGRGISPKLRVEILERNGFTCKWCGRTSGDPDPFNPSRKIQLHIDHIIPISQGGTDEKDNLQALCSACNQGRANIQYPSESAINILARIRRSPKNVRREIYEVLKRSFGDE